MKRVLLAITLALLVPGMLNAATMGVYFDWQPPGQMTYSPVPFSPFDVYLYLHNAGYDFVTAVEYQLQTPSDPWHSKFGISAVTYPDNMTISQGDPFAGHSIAYWPPLDGQDPGYNQLCHYVCFTTEPCDSISGYQLVVGGHPDTGEIRGTYYPGMEIFTIDGLTSLVCPGTNAVEEKS